MRPAPAPQSNARWWLFPVALFAFTRVALVALVATSLWTLPLLYAGVGAKPMDLSLVTGFCQWDCQHYAHIAVQGYDEPFWVNFWPLLPLLARPLVWLRLAPTTAVIVVANAAALAAFVVVYRLFETLADEESARWGLTLFAVYPFAFFFSCGYPESLMVLAGAGALLCALRGHHIRAGLILGVGSLARHPTILAGLGLLVLQLEEVSYQPLALVRRRAFLGLLLPLAIVAVWPLFGALRFHDPLAFAHVRARWGWKMYLSLPKAFAHAREARMLIVYPWISLLPGAGAFSLLARRRWWPLAAIAIPSMLMYWAIAAWALGRYSAATWAAFLPLGVGLARRPMLRIGIVVSLAMLQGLFLHLFAHGYEVQ